MNYSATIGLEVHVQLATRTKMFCACNTDFGSPPNTHVCPVCLGYPGALPVINEEAVRLTVMTGLMLGSEINPFSKFDRKNYFYPDMPKNYQISQYDRPLCIGGAVAIEANGVAKTIPLTRIHLEEDVAKNMHVRNASSIDFNRAGHPLMEVVTEPELDSSEEAFAFLQALKQILLYGGISPCNLEEGNLRCDVNCSVRPAGQPALGVKTEIKNLNTFKGVFQSLQYEIKRQIAVLESGGTIVQETRRWETETGITESMRSKEAAHDYRYFPDPDLMPVVLSSEQIECWKALLPELPRQRCDRLVRQYSIPPYDARVLSADKAMADYFEEACRYYASSQATRSAHAVAPSAAAGDEKLAKTGPKAISNWLMTEMLRLLSEKGIDIDQAAIRPKALAELVRLAEAQVVNSNTAKDVFAALFEQGGDPELWVKQKGLVQVSDAGAIEAMVEKAMADHPGSVADFRAGKSAALQFLVGQVMRASKGKAHPQRVQELLKKKLTTTAN
ncbi:MAG: Asp-tRNA(Asn)/Glu-tRNA(Gln) amidotransferase subunit GatB [Kiritimatiellae bacterium]|nr:Asp-tRNA(Asn)/Glu-tRNA(Gln) amidotransferase subunit GatB [Verrucomicrobiota bacterium]MBU4292039.1 Asp-tRNA(Asn)/Glu-tRNA(Gln) amidotransferase subunit GatB [Verrucomicrobiota bacterium]MCG2678873.1 Asp-tRNA(Asn)/Glu-tRNA(Gln) amidotransferase subunit GatB [Kiritimatiellia bacterium]